MQVGNSLLLSKEFQSLHAGAQSLYLCMAMEAGGKREFTFPAKAATKYGIAENSFSRFKKELIASGFIRVKASGRTTREKNIYEFVFGWKERGQ